MFRKTKKAVALAMAALLAVHTAPELVVSAATAGWKLVVREQTPVDSVYFDTEDKVTGEKYLIGYKDKKVTIVDMNGKVVAKTQYTGVGTTSAVFHGKTALIVEKDGLMGLVDLQGKELLACSYQYIHMEDVCDNHTLIKYKKTDGSIMMKIDDQYVLENAEYGYFTKYNNELIVAVSRKKDGETLYDIYDLKGKKKDTLTWKQLYPGESVDDDDDYEEDTEREELISYCNKEAGKVKYEKAKEEWLLAKEDALMAGEQAYFEGTDFVFSKDSIYPGYQCLNGKMYYFLIASGIISKKQGGAEEGRHHNEYTDNITDIDFVQIYDENQNLIAEGQSNLDFLKATNSTCNEAFPFLVYVLDKEGNLLKFDAQKGSMEKIFAWKKGALFSKKNYPDLELAEKHNVQIYIYDDDYSIEEKTGGEPDLYVTYRINLFASVNGEKRVYMPEDKSTIQYDTGISESRFISDTRLFLKSTADNQTEVYRADTKLEKFAMLKEPIDVFNQKDTWKIEYAFVDWKNSENNVYCLVNKTDGKICFLGKDFGVVETCKDNFTKEQLRMMYVHMKEKGAFFVLAGSDLYDEYGDEKNITEDMKCRIAFLDRKTQTVSWKDISSEVYQAFQDNCVSVGNQDFYYSISGSKIHCIDFVEHAYKEINLANTMVQQAGTVDEIIEDYGKLYLHYYILDGKRRYYGYADLDGNILFDAAVLKSTDEYLEFDKIGEYFFCSNKLFDKDYKLIMDNASYWCLRYYDEVKQQYMESDFYTVYSTDKNSGEGFLYDAKTDRIILKFKDTGKRYRYGTVMGDYIMLTEEDNHYNSIYVNTATGKVEKELNNHYSIVDTKNKCYYAFMLKEGQTVIEDDETSETGSIPAVSPAPQTTKAPGNKVQKGKSYVVGKQTFKVTSTTAKTVTLTKTANKGTTETIPATVKIKGKTYKVTTIADNVYKDNKKIKKVVIGSNIKTIGKNVWKNCKNLTTIQIKTKVLAKVGSSAIKGTSTKLQISVPSGKKKTYQKLWKGKGNDKAKIG